MADGTENSGARIPYRRLGDPRDDRVRVGCALFADDAVGISPSIEKAITFCDIITEWTNANEMQVGIQKCGVLEIPVDPGGPLELTEQHPLRESLRISGELVPLVEEYIYLGMRITRRLDSAEMVRHRYKAGRATFVKLRPFLSSTALPMSMRVRVVQAVLLPRMLFGAELWGCNRALTDRVQKITNKALRLIVGLKSSKLHVSSVGIHREMGIKPICAIAAGRRLRAYRKCFLLKTQIGLFMRNPLRTQKWTWVTGCIRWSRRHCFRHATTPSLAGELQSWDELSPSATRAFVEACIVNRETDIRRRKGGYAGEITNAYINGNYKESSLTRSRVGGLAVDHQGYALIVRCRIGAIATASQMAEWGYLSARHTDRCPFCRKRCGGETIYHMLLKCKAWRQQRRDLLKETLRGIRAALAEMGGNDHDDDGIDEQSTLSWLLGGKYEGAGVENWMPANPADFRMEESDSDSESDGEEAPVQGDAGEELTVQRSRNVARFLVTIMRLRSQKIRQMTEHQRDIDVRDLVLAYTPGQRPDG